MEVKKQFILASISYGDNNYIDETNYDAMSEFSELSEDNDATNGDSSSDQDSSDTDPQEYEDYVDLNYYIEHIEKKHEPAQTSSSSNLRPHLILNDLGSSNTAPLEKPTKSLLQRRPHVKCVKSKQCLGEISLPIRCPKLTVEEPFLSTTSFEDDFESSLEFIEMGPRGTLKKADALNMINLTDIQGESTLSNLDYLAIFSIQSFKTQCL